MRTIGLGLALLTVTATGCAGSGMAESAVGAPGAPAGAKAAPVIAETVAAAPPAPPAYADSAGGAWGGSMQSMEPAPGRGASATPAAEPPATERPGLGTEWGETRRSESHDVDFQRAQWSHPFAVATLHYNDQRGVEALAAYHSFRGPRLREEPVVGGAITVSVRDSGNEPLPAIHVADRAYIIGEQGERYAIVIENHSNHRVEAVTTVDGLDVMNGRSGSVDNRGYVVDPYETVTIDGFRQSQKNVAAFRFAKVADSYAAQTGTARNVGVIGVAFFEERGDGFARWTPWTADELRRRDTADPFPGEGRRFAQPPGGRW